MVGEGDQEEVRTNWKKTETVVPVVMSFCGREDIIAISGCEYGQHGTREQLGRRRHTI